MTSCAKFAMSREPATRKMRASGEIGAEEGCIQRPMGADGAVACAPAGTGWSAAQAPAASIPSSSAPVAERIMRLLRPRDVFAGAGVDLQHLALVDEQRHTHDRTGLQLGGLLAAGGGITAHARVGLDHLQVDVRRRGHLQGHAVPQRHDAGDALLQPLRIVAHGLLAGGVLLEVVGHHEMPEVAVGIQVLHVRIDRVGGLHRIAALERALDGAAGLQVAHLHAVEGLALARLDHLVLDDRIGVVVEQDLETGLEFVGAVAGHGALWLNALRMSSGRRMIAAEPDARQPRAVPDWQRELAEAVRDPLELLSLLALSPADLGPGTTLQLLTEAARDFPLRVPRGFVARMRRGDA